MKITVVAGAVCLFAGLVSCDPGYRLVAVNTSGVDVPVKVVYDHPDSRWRKHFLDTGLSWNSRRFRDQSDMVYNSALYVVFYDSADKGFSKQKHVMARKQIYDSMCSCISLVLPAGEKVILEGGIGGPAHQRLIFNGTDTVDVPYSERMSTKFHFPSGTDWVAGSMVHDQ